MYANLGTLPYIPYKIMEFLALSDKKEAQMLWKMLKYNGYDALSKEDLSFDEKMSLVWKNGKQEKYGVFLTNLIEDAIAESKCVLKCYNYYIHAEELYTSTVVYAFDFLYGGQMSLVDMDGYPVSRGDLFVHCVLSLLNGAYVGGVGRLTFLNDMSRYDGAKSVIGNSKTFTGVCLYMSTLVGDTGGDSGCVLEH